MNADQLLLSLKSWPEENIEETSVSSLINRIQAQRGHFRDVNESLLEEEIAAGKDEPQDDELHGDLENKANGGTADKTVGDQESATELRNAKVKMAALVGHALNEALLGLDYISFLVSLHNPETGNLTMSPALKEAVPAGSLGFDKIQRKPDPKAIKDDEIVSRAWKMEGLNSAADALLSASEKLGREVEKESRYWEQVLAIRDEGWVITRIPRERQTLGVRYGFAESAAEYKSKGIGALRRGEDGSVVMDDVATTGSLGKAMLRVRVIENGEVKGVSVQSGNKKSTSVKDVIERARNFVYEDELFFEIMREARIMANQGIRTSEDGVTLQLGEHRSIIIDMAPLDDDTTLDFHSPESGLAQGVAMAFRILLSYNHRMSLKKRSKPPPALSPRKQPVPPLLLVRPIATHLIHHQHLRHLQGLLKSLIGIAKSAGLHGEYSLKPLQNCRQPEIKDVESAVDTFMGRLESEATLVLPGGWKVEIQMSTMLGHPLYGTGFTINTSHDGVSARLMGENKFSSVEEMELYLCWCLERSVVNEIRCMGDKWQQIAQGNEMRNVEKQTRKIRAEATRVGLSIVTGATGGTDTRFVWDGSEAGKSLQDLLKEF
ncbi:subunit 17 of mediator complex-domain-containing protein [Morchella snyderi]|nr:subunit 17 of mediator complex-domain-containing protein [Morchella snyderi]